MRIKPHSITVKLTLEQGAEIKDLIQEKFPFTFPKYCGMVGIKAPNFYNTLNGERPCSLEFLNKLLSGIQYEVTASNMELQIQEMEIGEVVPDVDSMLQDDELSSEATEALEQPNLDLRDFSSSEKHPDP